MLKLQGVPIAGVLSWKLPPASMVLYIDMLFDIAYSVPGLLGLIAIRVILVMPIIGTSLPAKVHVAPPLTLIYPADRSDIDCRMSYRIDRDCLDRPDYSA